jgi:thiamine-phosphate pyrophosphorylase
LACERLDFLPRRPELATEHLLLGLVLANHEVGVWLAERGLHPDPIEAEIRALYGFTVSDTSAVLDYEREEPMYERFTDRARKAMQLANQEAHRFNHEYIGTEHILLGLVKEGSGVAVHVLKSLGIDLRKIRLEVEKLIQSGRDEVMTEKLPQPPRAKQVIEYAMEEARNLGRNYVGSEHILLGLLREREGVAAHVLMNLGLNLENVRNEVLAVLGHGLEPVERHIGLPIAPISPIAPRGSLAGHTVALKETAVIRVLDAAANRAREGLRVIEDYVRFVLDDRHLTELCKQLRHHLTAALSQVSTDRRMAARETQGDVGTVLTTPSERRRDDVNSIARANFARLQESLRSLEEFHKLAEPEIPDVFKQLRYRTYTLERAVEITHGSIERLAAVRLYVLVDGRDSPEEFERLVVSLIQAGVHAIQLRDKKLGDRELLAAANLLRTLTRDTPVLCIVNDRPDLAALAQADGVHVGQEELSVKDARQIVGTAALVGVSTHTIEQARQAVLDGANYIGVGPTFPSGTKTFTDFPGLYLLRAVAAEIRLPAFAIGGITAENLPSVLSTGLPRIAVSAAITAAADPAAATRKLLAGLGT